MNICISKYANGDGMSITNHANVDQVDIINASTFIYILINSKLIDIDKNVLNNRSKVHVGY